MKKKKRDKIKEIKRAIGRLQTPPPKVIEDKRTKLRDEATQKDLEQGS